MERLIIASKNQDKVREIKMLLRGLPLQISSLLDFKKKPKIIEDGKDFYENARKKAKITSSFYRTLSLGEDSGLEVMALGNKPGVYSRRFAGKNASYHKNNLRLLKFLEGLPLKERRAKFCTWVVLAKKGRVIKAFKGELKGFIWMKEAGKKGFGYDPVFYLPRFKKTVAQLSLKQKNMISHRAKACLKLKKFLAKYVKNK